MSVKIQKALAFALIVILILTLTVSCEQRKEETIPIPQSFESDFEGSIGKLKIAGRIKRVSYGMCKITLSSPETLNGLEIDCLGETVTLRFEDVRIEEDYSSFPANSLIRSVVSALDTLGNSRFLTIQNNGDNIKYSSEEGGFYAIQNKADGSLKSLMIDKDQIFIDFTSFSEAD